MSCIPWITKVGRSLWAMRYFIGNRQHLLLSELHRIWGDVFWFFLGTRRATVLADPAAIREMFQQPADVLSAAESRRRLIGVLPSKSIPYQTGPARARARRAMAQAFSQTSARYSTDALLTQLIERLRGGDIISEAIEDFCYQLASYFVLGKCDQQVFHQLKSAAESATRNINPIVLGLPWLRRLPVIARRFRRLAETRDTFLATIDDLLNEDLPADSLAHHLLRIGTELGMERAEIRDNLGMVALATAFNLRIVIINAVHSVADSREWQQRLRSAEQDDAYSKSASAIARAMIQESLRISPVVPLISRMVKQDVTIGGVNLRAGQFVFASPWVTHFRESRYESAHVYDPVRFLNGERHDFSFIPFGGGTSQCLGGGWSINLASTVIRRITSEFLIHGENCRNDPQQLRYEVFNLVRRGCDARVAPLQDTNETAATCA